MKIQKGIVKYKDRNDIVCEYGVDDNGIQYFFISEIGDGSHIASIELKEAIDSMVKATCIGIIDKDGKIVVPFENKAIKTTDNKDVIVVEKAIPTSQNVLDAISKRSDTETAASLVSASATIKDKMNAKMGPEGRFIINDQFSEATICDVNGTNLVNNEFYSFIGTADNKLYLCKNIPESDVVLFSLETKSIVEPEKSNEVIDVQTTGVDPQSVESALSDETNLNKENEENAESISTEVVENNQEENKELVKTPSENPMNGFVPPLDLANFFQGEGVPEGEEVKSDAVETAPPMVDSETVKETVEGTGMKEEAPKDDTMPAIPGPIVDSETVKETIEGTEVEGVKEDTPQENSFVPPIIPGALMNSEINPMDLVSNNEVEKDSLNDSPISPTDMPSVNDAKEDNAASEEEAKEETEPQEEQSQEQPSEATAEEVKEETETKDEEEKQDPMIPPIVEEDTKEEDKDDSIVPPIVEEDEEDVSTAEDVAAIPLNNPVSFNPEALGKLDDEKEEKVEDSVSVPPIDSIKEVEEEKPVEFNHNVTTIAPSDVASAVDKDNNGILDSDEFKSTPVKDRLDIDLDTPIDDLKDLDIDHYDDYQESSSSDNLMQDVARSMTELMKQNREQKSIISRTQARLEESESQRRILADRYKDQVSRYESLTSKLRSLDSLTTRLETKVKDQTRTIDNQARELKSLRSQLNSKNELAQILEDAKQLLDENNQYDSDDSYRMKAA